MEKAVVLVADDDPDVLRLTVTNLRSEGFTVIEASSGGDAIERFAELRRTNQSPDVVLLDVMMPKMSGFEAYQVIRSLPGGENVPVAFLTAHGDNRDGALELAANDFIQKPVRREQLVQRVRALVRAKRFADAIRAGQDEGIERRLALLRELRETLVEPVSAITHGAKAAQAILELPAAAREHLAEIERRAGDLARLVEALEKRVGG